MLFSFHIISAMHDTLTFRGAETNIKHCFKRFEGSILLRVVKPIRSIYKMVARTFTVTPYAM